VDKLDGSDAYFGQIGSDFYYYLTWPQVTAR
jgi:hypothetical protein